MIGGYSFNLYVDMNTCTKCISKSISHNDNGIILPFKNNPEKDNTCCNHNNCDREYDENDTNSSSSDDIDGIYVDSGLVMCDMCLYDEKEHKHGILNDESEKTNNNKDKSYKFTIKNDAHDMDIDKNIIANDHDCENESKNGDSSKKSKTESDYDICMQLKQQLLELKMFEQKEFSYEIKKLKHCSLKLDWSDFFEPDLKNTNINSNDNSDNDNGYENLLVQPLLKL